jgi:hypothetical protein
MGTQNGDTKWGHKMGTQNGDTKWGHKMGTQNGDTKWGHTNEHHTQMGTQMDTQDGHTRWTHKMDTQDGHTRWTHEMDTHRWTTTNQDVNLPVANVRLIYVHFQPLPLFAATVIQVLPENHTLHHSCAELYLVHFFVDQFFRR